MKTYRVSDGIVEVLRDRGVRYFFSVSGANIEPIHDSIYLHGQGLLRSILAKHESGAGFMADAHARVHKTLGVCGSTSGGGMLNLLAAIAEANVSSVPLLALVGQPPTHLWGKGAFQDSSGFGRAPNALDLFAHVSKFACLISDPSKALDDLENAITAATSGRPGASVLLLPRDILLSPLHQNLAHRTVTFEQGNLSPPDPVTVESVAKEIANAKSPLLILGQGVQRSQGQNRTVEFAEALSMPVLVTLSGKGSFPNQHPLFRGVLSSSGHPGAVKALASADLAVVVGAGLNIMTRDPVKDMLQSKRLVYINAEVDYIDRIATPAVKLIGDAGQCMSALLKAITAIGRPMPGNGLKRSDPATLKPNEHYFERGSDAYPRHETTLSMYEAVEAIRDIIPSNARLLVDAGNAGATACHLLPCPDQGSFVTALGMGGMGWAVAGSIGAALATTPGETQLTVVIAGDGAVLMNGSELNTIAAYRLPVVMVVLNNASHGMCVTRQTLFFDSRIEAVEYPEIDVARYASSLVGDSGIFTARAQSREALREAFKHAIALRKPALIDVRVTRDEIPPFAPFLRAADELLMSRQEKAA
ncbi:MAG: thiamine pyrophosphate-binding protein [Candidatus Methylumidiphilus sp.]